MSQAQTGEHWPFEDHEEEGKASMTGAEPGRGGHWGGVTEVMGPDSGGLPRPLSGWGYSVNGIV